jgi:hypothetical protein
MSTKSRQPALPRIDEVYRIILSSIISRPRTFRISVVQGDIRKVNDIHSLSMLASQKLSEKQRGCYKIWHNGTAKRIFTPVTRHGVPQRPPQKERGSLQRRIKQSLQASIAFQTVSQILYKVELRVVLVLVREWELKHEGTKRRKRRKGSLIRAFVLSCFKSMAITEGQ